jgi:predicted RNase H-like nuclease (RuvC/YqgF family)
MSIRMVAIELYRVIKEIERLERKLEGLRPEVPEREGCERELFKARAEHARLKSMLDGAKDS